MSFEKIRWAPRVRQAWIWQLYQNDAGGTLDEDLLLKTGHGLLARAQSILHATRGEVECPHCAAVYALDHALAPATPQPCPSACGWSCTWDEFGASRRHMELLAANALASFEEYARLYPVVKTPEARLFRIDRLLHAFHWDSKFNTPNRSVANNLVEGSHAQVVALLDRIFASRSTPEDTLWHQTAAEMQRLRKGNPK